jgi:hypothetical protein
LSTLDKFWNLENSNADLSLNGRRVSVKNKLNSSMWMSMEGGGVLYLTLKLFNKLFEEIKH